MANFTNKQINKTYKRLVQVDGAVLQDRLGNTLSGSMSDLTVNGTLSITGHSNVSESLTRLDTFSSSLNDTFATDAELNSVSSSLASETAQLLDFSASLNNDFATDAELDTAVSALNAATGSYALKTSISGSFNTVSSSLALRLANQENFSSSLDATFATDTEVSTAVSGLNAATSSYAIKTQISGSFNELSSSIATRFDNSDVSGLNAATGSYALKTQITGSFNELSSSIATRFDNIVHSDVSALNAATGSYALKTQISGSFTLASSSIDSTIKQNENDRDEQHNALSASIQLRVETNETSIIELLNHSGSLTNIFAEVEYEGKVDRIEAETGSYVRAAQTGSFLRRKSATSTPLKDHVLPTIISGSASDVIWITGSTYSNSEMLYLNYSGSNGEVDLRLPNCQFTYNTYRYIWVQADSTITNTKYFKLYASGSQTINGSTDPFIISSSYQTTRVWSDGKEWIRIIN